MKTKTKLHNWLIKKIVGKKQVIMNSTVYGNVWIDKRKEVLLINNKFIDKPKNTRIAPTSLRNKP